MNHNIERYLPFPLLLWRAITNIRLEFTIFVLKNKIWSFSKTTIC